MNGGQRAERAVPAVGAARGTIVCRPLLAAVCAALDRVRAVDLTFAEHAMEVLQVSFVGRCRRGRSSLGRHGFTGFWRREQLEAGLPDKRSRCRETQHISRDADRGPSWGAQADDGRFSPPCHRSWYSAITSSAGITATAMLVT